jgi:hypothetical protein
VAVLANPLLVDMKNLAWAAVAKKLMADLSATPGMSKGK